MEYHLFSVRYEDRDAAALMFKRLKEQHEDLGLGALGLEKLKGSFKDAMQYKIILAVKHPLSQNIPGLLRTVQHSLKDHPLYPYVSFDFHIKPIADDNWNFDSYDDPEYQKIFIIKRKDL